MRSLSAFTAVVFYLVAICGALVLGAADVQNIALWSVLVAAWAQFLALDDRIIVLRFSVCVSYVAMGLAAWALVLL